MGDTTDFVEEINGVLYLRDFICVHTQEGVDRAKSILDDVYKRLACSAEDLLTAVVVDLNWTYDVDVTGLPNDQWSAVDARSYDFSSGSDDGGNYPLLLKARIECDRLEHGVARLWQLIADLHDEITAFKS